MLSVFSVPHEHGADCENSGGGTPCRARTLGDALDASLRADMELGKAQCAFQSLNVQLRHLASWRLRHPEDSGVLVAIRRTLAKAQNRLAEANAAYAASTNATHTLVLELAQTSGVCAVCAGPALHGVCDDCDRVLSEPPF